MKNALITVMGISLIAISTLLYVDEQQLRAAATHTAAIANLEYSKWGNPKITSDMWDGTKLWQARTNEQTGIVEMRCQTISAGGGYK